MISPACSIRFWMDGSSVMGEVLLFECVDLTRLVGGDSTESSCDRLPPSLSVSTSLKSSSASRAAAAAAP